MKRSMLVVSLLFGISLTIFAQGIYFDVGIGIGKAKTLLDNKDFKDLMDSSVKEVGVDFGLKVGYGPIAGVPFYIVGDISGIGHRFDDSINYIQFNSYLIGPGVIYYPTSFLQLGASFGYSFVSNQTDLPIEMYKSKSGYAGNISAAFDIGKGNHGCLLGVKYLQAVNKLEVSGVEQKSSLFSLFIRYAYRHK